MRNNNQNLPDGETLHREALLSRFSGDPEFYDEIVQVFTVSCPALLSDIEESLKQDDGVHLAAAAHTLKGAVVNFSNGPAAALLTKLEMRAEADNLVAARQILPLLRKEIERLTEALESLKEDMQ